MSEATATVGVHSGSPFFKSTWCVRVGAGFFGAVSPIDMIEIIATSSDVLHPSSDGLLLASCYLRFVWAKAGIFKSPLGPPGPRSITSWHLSPGTHNLYMCFLIHATISTSPIINDHTLDVHIHVNIFTSCPWRPWDVDW